MSMYPSVGAALINAFNASLFDSYKAAGWQVLASALGDKWPELEPIKKDFICYDKDRLRRVDWATQAGMTAGLLRETLKPAHYHVLKMRYTHDGDDIEAGDHSITLKLTSNTRSALIEGWPLVSRALIEGGCVRRTTAKNPVRYQYLALRAIRPDLVIKAFKATGTERQNTVNKHQSEIKKGVLALADAALNAARIELEQAGLIVGDYS